MSSTSSPSGKDLKAFERELEQLKHNHKARVADIQNLAKVDAETRYRLINAEKQRYNLVVKIFKEQFDHSRRMATLKRFHGIDEGARQHLLSIERKRFRSALAPSGVSEVKVTMGIIVALLVTTFAFFLFNAPISQFQLYRELFEPGWMLTLQIIGGLISIGAGIALITEVRDDSSSDRLIPWTIVLLAGISIAYRDWGPSVALAGIVVAVLLRTKQPVKQQKAKDDDSNILPNEHFYCPHCSAEQSSSIINAGNAEMCTSCGSPYTVPVHTA